MNRFVINLLKLLFYITNNEKGINLQGYKADKSSTPSKLTCCTGLCGRSGGKSYWCSWRFRLVVDVDWKQLADPSAVPHLIHLLLELSLQDMKRRVLRNIWINISSQSIPLCFCFISYAQQNSKKLNKAFGGSIRMCAEINKRT